jgi:hypothetical protein
VWVAAGTGAILLDETTGNKYLIASRLTSIAPEFRLGQIEERELITLTQLAMGPKAVFIDRNVIKNNPLFVDFDFKTRPSAQDKLQALRNSIFRKAMRQLRQ